MNIISLFLLFLLSGNPTGLTISDEMVTLVIDKHTTQVEIVEFNKRLKEEKGITFYVYSITRSKEGEIEYIKIVVDCNDGNSGTATVKFNSKNEKIGFFRDYRPGASTSFSIGGMD